MHRTPLIPLDGWPLLADINNDGVVDSLDAAWLGQKWMQSGEENFSDFDRDGVTDANDLFWLCDEWLMEAVWQM
jgi:hypothetical protein